MFRASSCPSSGEWYKIDSACGVQHWLCCRRLVEKRWLVCTCWEWFHKCTPTTSSPRVFFNTTSAVHHRRCRFISVSTCFGYHHAHHQENGTKSTAPMVYSTGCVAEDS